MKAALFVAALFTSAAYPTDLDSWCSGFCSSRYYSGFWSEKDQKCACYDLYPMNTKGKVDPLYRPRKPVFGYIYE